MPAATSKTIRQKEYLDIEVDNSEPDIVQLLTVGKSESNLIPIERAKLPALIQHLQTLIDQ